MDPNINNNQNIEENNSLIHQIELKENYNNIDSNLNPNIKIIHLKKKEKNNDFSSDFINSENFINKKRIKPDGVLQHIYFCSRQHLRQMLSQHGILQQFRGSSSRHPSNCIKR